MTDRYSTRTDGPTANDRFKLRAARYKWVAGVLAVIIHILAFLLIPPFRAQAVTPRMVVQVGDWEPPARPDPLLDDYTALDTTMVAPTLRNGPDLDRRLPRFYPWLLWHYREPSSALVQVAVGSSGRVRKVTLLDSQDSTAEAALLEIARRMKVVLPGLPEGSDGMLATVRISVVEP